MWPQSLTRLSVPSQFSEFCTKTLPWTFTIGIVAIAIGSVWGLVFAPTDYQQGEAFRIIYVHVPCAMLSLFLYAWMAACSFIYLVWRIKIADFLAYSIAPLGAFFTFAALVTGSLWGKPMWGTWWIWDARLTSELILLFLYLGYLGLYQAVPSRKVASKLCAILALVGIVDLPIIHYSVYWWNTLHQGATLLQLSRPAIDLQMLYPLLVMLIGLFSYTLFLVSLRVRAEIRERESERKGETV
jgi:heme exporter protein C